MLEIICVASLSLSTNANVCSKLINQASIKTLEISQTLPSNSNPHYIYLAKGKPYKSRYREEADRYREDYERNHEGLRDEVNESEVRDGRIYRDADHYRRESDDQYERVRDSRNSRDGRIYRDNDYNQRESEYEYEREDDIRYDRQERYWDQFIWRGDY